MDATSLLVDKDEICGRMQILQYDVKVSHKLLLGYKFHPLYQNMNISSLEQNVLPFRLLDHIKNEAYVILLILPNLIIFLYFPQHTNNAEQRILLQLSL